MPEQLRLMAVHAHPDDESSKGAATMARYVQEGVDVLVVTCTGGERGDVLNAAAQADVETLGLAEVRRREMADAAAILGVRQVWLGFEDSGFPEGDPKPPVPEGSFAALPLDVVTEPLVALIREFRPHVLTTYDELGGYPHPDHIRTHEISMAAFEAAADPTAYPALGEPWEVAKVYYHFTFSYGRVSALHQALLARGMESPYGEWLEGWEDHERDKRITTRVPCAEWFEIRDAALLAHRTQIDPEGRWFAVPLELQREVWPTEDYELAVSRITSPTPESDLFAGLRGA